MRNHTQYHTAQFYKQKYTCVRVKFNMLHLKPQIRKVALLLVYSTRRFMGKFSTSSCNANCGCTLENYNPVCGIDGIMYYSPCYAGCSESIPDTDPVVSGIVG